MDGAKLMKKSRLKRLSDTEADQNIKNNESTKKNHKSVKIKKKMKKNKKKSAS